MIAMPLVRSSVFSRLVASHPSNAGHHQVHEDHARAHADGDLNCFAAVLRSMNDETAEDEIL